MPSNVTTESYISYFRKIAISNPEIAHDPESETADSDPQKKKFTRWSADEAINGLRNKIGFPALLLEMYEVQSRAEVPYDVKGFYTGAFTIVAHATNGDVSTEEEAFKTTERIYQNILKQIFQDHYGKNKDRCSTPFAEFSFSNMNIVPVGPLFENEFGWRIEFQFKPLYLLKITDMPYGVIEELSPDGGFLFADGYVEVPAGRLVDKVLVQPEVESSITAGLTEGSDNVMAATETPTAANGDRIVSQDIVCREKTKIYFSGITGKTKVIVYARKLS